MQKKTWYGVPPCDRNLYRENLRRKIESFAKRVFNPIMVQVSMHLAFQADRLQKLKEKKTKRVK